MIAIGIRVYSDSSIYYCIIRKDGEELNYHTVSKINVPLSLEKPEALNFVRNTLLDILIAYNVQSAVVRIPEIVTNPLFVKKIDKKAIERYYLEGVIQESLAGSNVNKFLVGQIAELTKVAGMIKTDFKRYADAEIDFQLIPSGLNWKKDFTFEERESILACITALNL